MCFTDIGDNQMAQEVKATKREVLSLFSEKESRREQVRIPDLMNEFGYSFHGARTRLDRLIRSGDVKGIGKVIPGAYLLTVKGYKTLESYDERGPRRIEPE